MRGSRGICQLATVAMLATGGLRAAHAQTLRGTVLDSDSGEPVMLAYVGLLAEGREMVVADLSTSSGEFILSAPVAGSYFLYVARTGYETLMDGLFELGEDGEFSVRVGIKPAPVEIEPVLVEATRDESPLEAVGFYQRAVTGKGHFVIREEIERVAVDRITDAFRSVPAVGVISTRPLTGGPEVMQSPEIVMRRGGAQCSPTLYVDRAVVAFGTNGAVRPDDWVSPMDVEAIEVYSRPSQVPVEFDAIGDCGVVLIWTRKR